MLFNKSILTIMFLKFNSVQRISIINNQIILRFPLNHQNVHLMSDSLIQVKKSPAKLWQTHNTNPNETENKINIRGFFVLCFFNNCMALVKKKLLIWS